MSEVSTHDSEYINLGHDVEQNLSISLEKLRLINEKVNEKSTQELQRAIEFRKQNNIDMTKKCLKTKMIVDLSNKTIQNLLTNLEEQLNTIKQAEILSYLPSLLPINDQEEDEDINKSPDATDAFSELQDALKYLLKTINILQRAYDNNDQIAEQEQQKADEFEMQQNMEMFQKCFIKKNKIDSSNEIIMLILSKLQKYQFVIKDCQMSISRLMDLINSEANKPELNESQLITSDENQHEIFADPFKIYDLFLSKVEEKLQQLIENPKFSQDSNSEEAISAISIILDLNDIKDVNPFGSSIFDADENEVEEGDDDFDGFVNF